MTLEERRRQAEAAARARAAVAPDGPAGVPAAGDLLWLAATAKLPVEWAVVEEGPGGWTLVPADTNPAAGSADVGVDAGTACGPLTLRCAFAARLATGELGDFRRSGRLPAAALVQARERLASLAAGENVAAAGEEIDADPEYADWIAEAVRPARQALLPSSGAASSLRSRPAGARRRRLEIAASALLAAGVTLAASQAWHRAALHEAEAGRMLAAEQAARRETELARRAADGDRARREAATLRERLAIAESRAAGTPPQTPAGVGPLLNPQIAWLQPPGGAERGEARPVAVAADAERVYFVLETWSPKPYPKYRVVLTGPGEARLWQGDGLIAQGSSEIVFGLPARLLPEGELAFQLYGLGEAGAVPLERYAARIERRR